MRGAADDANIRSMIVAVLLPRFSLLVALAGERQELLGKPVALAPELGRAQYIGETSPAASPTIASSSKVNPSGTCPE